MKCQVEINTENEKDKVFGISVRRRHQFKRDVVWGEVVKVIHSNGIYG